MKLNFHILYNTQFMFQIFNYVCFKISVSLSMCISVYVPCVCLYNCIACITIFVKYHTGNTVTDYFP